MKRFLIYVAIILTLPLSVVGQTKDGFDEFRKNLLNGYSSFHKTTMDNYKSFRDSINQEYAKALGKPWHKKEIIEGNPIPEWNIKPIQPVIWDKEKDITYPPVEEVPVVIKPVLPLEEKPQPYVPIKEDVVDVESVPLNFLFYGTKITVNVPNGFNFQLQGLKEKQISDTWMQLSESVTEQMLNDCLILRETLQLCDWAYLQMLRTISEELCGGNKNNSTLLQAYLFCQSGYKMRLARSNNRLYLLFSSNHTIYNWDYYHVDGETFYPQDCEERNLSICQAEYPQEKSLSLLIRKNPQLENKPSFRRNLFGLSVQVNENLIQFYETYPTSSYNNDCMTRWAMYANTPVDKYTAKILYPQLKSQIANMKTPQALQYLLTFVQKAFDYEYDDKVWGRDRAFFAEETLFYPYADCEDRSILFTHLVRDLLGVRCALIYSPGHLYTAVSLNEYVQGDAMIIDSERFLICDPTYINASIGMIMPNVNKEKTKAIILENNHYEIPQSQHSIPEIQIEHTAYTVSYNPENKIPNWVAWTLDSTDLVERVGRSNRFLPDPSLDSDMAVTTDEYKACGWDRGHMCPAGDNKWNRDAMNESFYMTNICPQNRSLNSGDWNELEIACRKWAAVEPVYIACGPILYDTPKYGYIGVKHKIRIPDAFFKVILTGMETGNPKAIGFIYKNESGNNKRDKYVNSIDQMERITGYDFFSALPDDIEERIEQAYDLKDWR